MDWNKLASDMAESIVALSRPRIEYMLAWNAVKGTDHSLPDYETEAFTALMEKAEKISPGLQWYDIGPQQKYRLALSLLRHGKQ